MTDLVHRLRERARIRRQIGTRKSVLFGQPDRIADLLEESATEIERQEAQIIDMGKFGVGIEREDWVKAVADAIEPKFRGFGHGDTPRQIAHEVAVTAVAAIDPLIKEILAEIALLKASWVESFDGTAIRRS